MSFRLMTLLVEALIGLFGLSMIKSGAKSSFSPRPLQVEQAPRGELKEKRRCEISGIFVWQLIHANCSENRWSFFVDRLWIMAIPLDWLTAVSMDS